MRVINSPPLHVIFCVQQLSLEMDFLLLNKKENRIFKKIQHVIEYNESINIGVAINPRIQSLLVYLLERNENINKELEAVEGMLFVVDF